MDCPGWLKHVETHIKEQTPMENSQKGQIGFVQQGYPGRGTPGTVLLSCKNKFWGHSLLDSGVFFLFIKIRVLSMLRVVRIDCKVKTMQKCALNNSWNYPLSIQCYSSKFSFWIKNLVSFGFVQHHFHSAQQGKSDMSLFGVWTKR